MLLLFVPWEISSAWRCFVKIMHLIISQQPNFKWHALSEKQMNWFWKDLPDSTYMYIRCLIWHLNSIAAKSESKWFLSSGTLLSISVWKPNASFIIYEKEANKKNGNSRDWRDLKVPIISSNIPSSRRL